MLKNLLYVYRITSSKRKLSGFREFGHAFWGYAMASGFSFSAAALNAVAVAGLLMSSHALDDFFDWKIDREKNAISRAFTARNVSLARVLFIMLFPLTLTGTLFFLVDRHLAIILFLFGSFLLGLYSLPPFRFKMRPLLGFIIPIIAGVVLFLEAAAVLGDLTPKILLLALPLLFFQGHLAVLHVLEDSTQPTAARRMRPESALRYLRLFPILSFVVSLVIALQYPIFLISAAFALVRLHAVRDFRIERVRKIRRNLFSPVLSLHEFAIYGILGILNLF